MKPHRRQHLIATLFPASMLDQVRRQSQLQAERHSSEIVFLTGSHVRSGRCVRLIAEEYARSGKTIRVLRNL